MRRSVLFSLLLPWVLVPLACSPSGERHEHAPWSERNPRWGARLEIEDLRIEECSGVVASRRHPGIRWVHNDSGDRARIFSLDAAGKSLGEVRIEGARNVDWEELAIDEDDRLYICDVGNNFSHRKNLRVYVVEEPEPVGQESAELLRTLRLRYPEQTQWPDPARRFDCEAAFVLRGRLHIITKNPTAGPSRVYRVVDMQSEEEQALEFLDEFDTGSQVTAADLSPTGEQLAVLSYEYIHLYRLRAEEKPLLSEAASVALPIEARQCEGIAYADGVLWVVNEQREIHLFSVTDLERSPDWTAGYFPPRDEFELSAEGMTALPLQKGFGEKRVALPSPPDTASVVLEREGDTLRLGLRWTPVEGGNDHGIQAWICWGPASRELICGPGDNALRLMYDPDGEPALLPDPIAPESTIPAHSLHRQGNYIEGWIELRGAAGAPGERALSVVLLSPGGADWHFGGDSSMFAWRNPVLWGVLR